MQNKMKSSDFNSSKEMGCSIYKHTTSPSLDNIEDLCCTIGRLSKVSKKEKDLIRDTWILLEDDMENIGIQVFLRIFDQNPKIKQLFTFRDCWGDALLTHPMFKAHANRFMVVIKQAVERMDDLETSYGQVLVRLGSLHAGNQDFCTDNFALFTDALIYIWKQKLQGKMTDEVLEAWRLLFHYINLKLQQGFEVSKCPQAAAVSGLNNGTSHISEPNKERPGVKQTEIW